MKIKTTYQKKKEKERPKRSRADFLPHTHPFASLSREGEDRKGEGNNQTRTKLSHGIPHPATKQQVLRGGEVASAGGQASRSQPCRKPAPASHSRPQRAVKALPCLSFENVQGHILFLSNSCRYWGLRQARHHSLCFLDLYVYFLCQVRDSFFHYFLK